LAKVSSPNFHPFLFHYGSGEVFELLNDLLESNPHSLKKKWAIRPLFFLPHTYTKQSIAQAQGAAHLGLRFNLHG
jgi:hypothetical protein